MAVEEGEVGVDDRAVVGDRSVAGDRAVVGDRAVGGANLAPPRRWNNPKSPDAEVALFDVTNNHFQTVKRRDAESGRRLR
jgi:hypothetical protein